MPSTEYSKWIKCWINLCVLKITKLIRVRSGAQLRNCLNSKLLFPLLQIAVSVLWYLSFLHFTLFCVSLMLPHCLIVISVQILFFLTGSKPLVVIKCISIPTRSFNQFAFIQQIFSIYSVQGPMLDARNIVVDKRDVVFIKITFLYFPKCLKLSITINIVMVKSERSEINCLSTNPDSSAY